MLSKDAVKLLRRVKKQILLEPRQFVMGYYFHSGTLLDYGEGACDLPRKKIPNCGTAACIAGWVISLDSKQKPSEANQTFRSPEETAGNALGLDLFGGGRLELFRVDFWPAPYETAWFKAKTHRTRAQVAARRIEAFIREHFK